MSSFAPRALVEPITRQPLPYGLFSVLQPRPESDPHWQNGVEWEALTCEPVTGFGVDCDDSTIPIPDNGPELGDADPFQLEGTYTCGHDVQLAQDRAKEHLLAREEAGAEYSLWTGAYGNTGFAEGAVNARGSATAVKLGLAVASLEEFIAKQYGSLGVVHLTREAAALGLSMGAVLAVRGSGLYTLLGTPVIAGAGYPGTGPAGQAPSGDSTYVYATPALLGYRSEVFTAATPVGASLNRSNNDILGTALRTYVIGWDPCPVGYALADLGA